MDLWISSILFQTRCRPLYVNSSAEHPANVVQSEGVSPSESSVNNADYPPGNCFIDRALLAWDKTGRRGEKGRSRGFATPLVYTVPVAVLPPPHKRSSRIFYLLCPESSKPPYSSFRFLQRNSAIFTLFSSRFLFLYICSLFASCFSIQF